MKYYLVKCKFGHVGRNKYLLLTRPIIVDNVKEACKRAKSIDVVKRDYKNWCIKYPTEVTVDTFIKAKNDFDNVFYFEKKNRHRLELFKNRSIDEDLEYYLNIFGGLSL